MTFAWRALYFAYCHGFGLLPGFLLSDMVEIVGGEHLGFSLVGILPRVEAYAERLHEVVGFLCQVDGRVGEWG